MRVQPLEGDRTRLAGSPYSVLSNNIANAKIERLAGGVPEIGIEDRWVPSIRSIIYPETNNDFDDAVFQVLGATVEGNRIIVSPPLI